MSVPGSAASLEWCVDVGRTAPFVGEGRTRELWELLASTADDDVAAARMLEPHLDALSILHQAGVDFATGADSWGLEGIGADRDSSWGVFAAEAAGLRVDATHAHGAWTLSGTKPWCSLAGRLSHALVTAFVDDTQRRLFAVDLRSSGVTAQQGPWVARGLPSIVSAPVHFEGAAAVPVGENGWYLSRPGFARGGMSVAACWWGGARGLIDPLREAARTERADQLALVHLGRVDAALWAAHAVLGAAADIIDGVGPGAGDDVDERLLAERVRATVADAAGLALRESDAALGPAPLVTDAAHAARVADLHLYLRQHHGPRDLARIGRLSINETATS